MKGSMTIQPHYIEAARRYLNRAAADRYAAGDMSSTDDAGHEAIAAMAGDVLEEWSDRRELREKLAAETIRAEIHSVESQIQADVILRQFSRMEEHFRRLKELDAQLNSAEDIEAELAAEEAAVAWEQETGQIVY